MFLTQLPVRARFFKGGLNVTLGETKLTAAIASLSKLYGSYKILFKDFPRKNLLLTNLQFKSVSVRLETKPWVKRLTLG